VLGAATGTLVAVLVLPTDPRDTVRAARVRYFGAVAAVLRTTAGTDGRQPPPEGPAGPDAALCLLDLRTQQLALVAAPFTSALGRPLVWVNDPRLGRGRMALHTALSLQIHKVAAAMAPATGGRPSPSRSR
jgi:hypothetical protein